MSDKKTTETVIRDVEIIGEAAGRLSNEFKTSHLGIDRKPLKGFATESFITISV